MSYAQEHDLDAAFGATEISQLSDRDGNGTRDSGVIAVALGKADALIDSKLAARFALPLASPYPPRLVDVACDLARHELYIGPPPEHVQVRYALALKQLDAVRDGLETLGLDAGGQPVENEMVIDIQSAPTVFKREKRDPWGFY